ncbi:hypothetical protein [Algoriphagus chordae]|uniref:Polyketide cyclase/dehydrase/lipid transport protein n=1 Tax=Algoriphagus chordae TaxID=237019 RepID=A0A2W7QCK3_9BACT|nr:hypothetical protein [Algoriphagus chordae]PZX46328.1 hypothetical protein LV85_04349 [Algoriphagus chordae]
MNTSKYLKGLAYGISYGLAARAIFALETSESALLPTYGLMTLSFMFLVPLAIGLLTAYHLDSITSASKILIITMPIFSILGLILITVLTGSEGLICAIMAIPIFAVMSLIGGFIGVNAFKRRKNDKTLVSLALLLPFLIAPIENLLGLQEKIFTETTSITIQSDEQEIWQQITRVNRISEDENNLTLFQFMGFPRPIEAELDTVAVGGIRKAIFARGLFFTETVTEVIPHKVLAFTIQADPNSIPPTALDQHVLVGGKYFDVMEGKYEIENIGKDQVKLILTSKFRLSTPFNFYSGLWSKFIMNDIQVNILKIIKERSEKI